MLNVINRKFVTVDFNNSLTFQVLCLFIVHLLDRYLIISQLSDQFIFNNIGHRCYSRSSQNLFFRFWYGLVRLPLISADPVIL
jgi:hypothetical protein